MRRTALMLALIALGGCGSETPGASVRASEAPRFTPQKPVPVADRAPAGRHLTARVARPTWLRAAPAGRRLERLRARTEFGSPMVVSVLERRDGWLKVLSALLPNDRHAWIPEDRARLAATDYEIRIDRSERRAELRHGGRLLRRFPVAVGRPGNETPLGRFAVTDELRPSDPSSPYGCCAIALTGHQTKLVPGWPGGDRLAIHGTPQPETIGRPSSLGCMRARRVDLIAVMRRIGLGTPVFVRA